MSEATKEKRKPTIAEAERQVKKLNSLIRKAKRNQTPEQREALKREQADKRRQRNNERHAAYTAAAGDVGFIPPPKHQARRLLCRDSLLLFLMAYFPHSTGQGLFGQAQIEVIDRIELAILGQGGSRILNCLPRGFSKSSISELAILWAVLYGHRKFVAFFGASDGEATTAIESIKTELEENERLAEDFPEVCIPVQALDGKPQRCNSQTHSGKHTHIGWTADTVVLPTITGSVASGAIIKSKGLMASARGMRHKDTSGRQLRPDFVIIDDPQTDDSAASPSQCHKRKRVIYKSILKLASHDKRLTAVINATVIQGGDLIDTLAEHHKDWQTVRAKGMPTMPKNLQSFWIDKYAAVRQSYDPNDKHDQTRAHREANELYLANREVADEGATVAWKHMPLLPDEPSVICKLMNVYIDDGPEVFASEIQNDPIKDETGIEFELVPELIQHRMGSHSRGQLPEGIEHITAAIDVSHSVLWFVVVGWTGTGQPFVIEYGTLPGQPDYFKKSDLKTTNIHNNPNPRTIMEWAGTDDLDTAITIALLGDEETDRPGLFELILDYEYGSGTGAKMVDRVGIDCNDPATKQTILNACSSSPYRSRITPVIGKADTLNQQLTLKVSETKRGSNVKAGLHCKLAPSPSGEYGQRRLTLSPNFWKTYVAKRLVCHSQSPNAMLLFKTQPHRHRLFAESCCSEEPFNVSAKGKSMVEWRAKSKSAVNDFWDCVVYNCALANIIGVRTHFKPSKQTSKPTPNKKPRGSGGFRDRLNRKNDWRAKVN